MSGKGAIGAPHFVEYDSGHDIDAPMGHMVNFKHTTAHKFSQFKIDWQKDTPIPIEFTRSAQFPMLVSPLLHGKPHQSVEEVLAAMVTGRFPPAWSHPWTGNAAGDRAGSYLESLLPPLPVSATTTLSQCLVGTLGWDDAPIIAEWLVEAAAQAGADGASDHSLMQPLVEHLANVDRIIRSCCARLTELQNMDSTLTATALTRWASGVTQWRLTDSDANSAHAPHVSLPMAATAALQDDSLWKPGEGETGEQLSLQDLTEHMREQSVNLLRSTLDFHPDFGYDEELVRGDCYNCGGCIHVPGGEARLFICAGADCPNACCDQLACLGPAWMASPTGEQEWMCPACIATDAPLRAPPLLLTCKETSPQGVGASPSSAAQQASTGGASFSHAPSRELRSRSLATTTPQTAIAPLAANETASPMNFSLITPALSLASKKPALPIDRLQLREQIANDDFGDVVEPSEEMQAAAMKAYDAYRFGSKRKRSKSPTPTLSHGMCIVKAPSDPDPQHPDSPWHEKRKGLVRDFHAISWLTAMRAMSDGTQHAVTPFTVVGSRGKLWLFTRTGMAARRAVASSVKNHSLDAMREPLDAARPDFAMMQLMHEAGVIKCPSGMPVFNPENLTKMMQAAIWKGLVHLSECINDGFKKEEMVTTALSSMDQLTEQIKLCHAKTAKQQRRETRVGETEAETES